MSGIQNEGASYGLLSSMVAEKGGKECLDVEVDNFNSINSMEKKSEGR